MSSLSFFRVGERNNGDHGPALRFDGLDSLRNANAAKRNIVLHSARDVLIPFILLNILSLRVPMTGRSNGCFAVSKHDIDEVGKKLSDGGLIYAWSVMDNRQSKQQRISKESVVGHNTEQCEQTPVTIRPKQLEHPVDEQRLSLYICHA